MEQMADLDIQGYLVVSGVMEYPAIEHAKHLFYQWLPDTYSITTGPHQHISTHYAGHTNMAWFCRTSPKIQAIYRQVLRCEDLITNYQGCGYNPRITKKKYSYIHTDQSPVQFRNHYQAFVSLTDNSVSTIQFIPGSHIYENELFMEDEMLENGSPTKEPQVVPEAFRNILTKRLVNVPVQRGDLVIWNSKMLYQETFGPEIRIVQYLGFGQKGPQKEVEKEKRVNAYTDFRTSQFRAFPLKLVPQPKGKSKEPVRGIIDQEIPSFEILDLVL